MPRKITIPAAVVVVALCLVALWGVFWRDGGATKGAIEWAEVTGGRDWLEDVSAWAQSIDLDREKPGPGDLGCFTMGNGNVFTTLGLLLPVSTTNNTLGPTYQKGVGFLGRDVIGLRIDGRDAACPAQSVRRVRRSGILRTTMQGDGYALETLTFVPPALDAIVRVIAIRNLSDRPFRAEAVIHLQRLAVDSIGPPTVLQRGALRVLSGVLGDGVRGEEGEVEVAEEGVPGAETGAVIGAIATVPFGKIGPKQGRAKVHYLAISQGAGGEAIRDELERGGLALLDETREWWQTWHEGLTRVRCPDARVADLIDDAQEVMKTQQAAGGGFSPMHVYSYCWARDSNGPIRYLLRCGGFEDVKRALDYYYEASARRGSISLNHGLAVSMTGETPDVEWSDMAMESAEVPSFLVLQHYWYYKCSGDLEPIESHWEYLKRNVEGQDVSADGRLPFHGDETYRFPGYAIWRASHTEPTDYVELDNLYSADSGFEYVAAAKAMSEMATALGKTAEAEHFNALAGRVREATERVYWQPRVGLYAPASSKFSSCMYRYPFANINLRPLWVGYQDPENPRAWENVLNTLSYLWREDGTVDATPGFGFTTGMTPGMVLYNLAAIDHAAAEQALEGVIEAFDPAAGMAEMLEPDNRPSGGVWGERRARPWEGGINAEAVLYYLTGFEPDAPRMRAKLCPRMPSGWASMEIDRMRLGGNRLAVSVNRSEGKTSYRLTNDGPGEVSVELAISLPQCTLGAITARGEPWEPKQAAVTWYGRTRQRCDIVLGPNGEAEVIVEHGPPAADPAGQIVRRSFRYPEPDVGRAQTVVVTLRPEMARKWRERDPNAFVIDTFVAFPASYLRGALLTADGKGRRVDTLVLDVGDWPGSFKLPAFWNAEGGAGARIVREFEQLGGRVVREEPPGSAGTKELPLYMGESFEEDDEEDDDED